MHSDWEEVLLITHSINLNSPQSQREPPSYHKRMTWQGNIRLLTRDQYQPDIRVLHQEKEGKEKEEINEWGERDGQRGKDNEVKTIVIKPIRKIDAQVGGLAY